MFISRPYAQVGRSFQHFNSFWEVDSARWSISYDMRHMEGVMTDAANELIVDNNVVPKYFCKEMAELASR